MLKELPVLAPKDYLRPFIIFFLLYVILSVAIANYQFVKYVFGLGPSTTFSFSSKVLFHGFLLSVLILLGNALRMYVKEMQGNGKSQKRIYLISLAMGFLFIYLIFWTFRAVGGGEGDEGLNSPYLAAIVGTVMLGVLGWGIEIEESI